MLIAEKDPAFAAALLQNMTGKFALQPGEEKKVEEERELRLAATNAFGGTAHPTCLGAQAYQWEDGMQWLIDTSGGLGWGDGTHLLANRWLHRLKTSRSLRQTVLGLPSGVAAGREDEEWIDDLASALNMEPGPTATSHDEAPATAKVANESATAQQPPHVAATSQEGLELEAAISHDKDALAAALVESEVEMEEKEEEEEEVEMEEKEEEEEEVEAVDYDPRRSWCRS